MNADNSSKEYLAPMRHHDQNGGSRCTRECIAVDLDGTLLRTDTLYECFANLLRCNPLRALSIPLWLFHGKAYVKRQLAKYSSIDVDSLPINEAVLEWLVERHKAGAEIILATAANRGIAETIAKRAGVFTAVLASSETENLSGLTKVHAIRSYFAGHDFCYVGNAHIDRTVWREARRAIAVDIPERLKKKLCKEHPNVVLLDNGKRSWKPYLMAIRPHQWLKNVLVFLPMLASHRIQIDKVVGALLAFVAFSLCASGVYLVNDLTDLAEDRKHPTKMCRPLASGSLPLLHGIVMVPLLLMAAFGISFAISIPFAGVLTIYLAITFGYSLYLKRKVLVDIIVLSLLYTNRIIAGAIAADVSPSFWLLAFSVFLFFSLAIVKRCRELQLLDSTGKLSTVGRGYHVSDLPILRTLGVGAGLMSVLVLALYINSPHVMQLYHRTYWLWGVCLLHLCWVSWVWLLMQRNEINDDPVVFSITDPVSLSLGALVVALVFLAI